jgi:hypothetical protein
VASIIDVTTWEQWLAMAQLGSKITYAARATDKMLSVNIDNLLLKLINVSVTRSSSRSRRAAASMQRLTLAQQRAWPPSS